MAWNISKAKRQALVKLQLRDKEGKFIEMGGGVKWYSSRLKKVVAGTVVGTKGANALVRLNKENPTHEPALVTVPAASIIAIEGKASLAPKGEPSADQTPEFEKPEAVADVEADPNAEAESDHESQLKGPQHLAVNYGITETSDGNTYITRKDGESIYSPARALKVGDELISPAGADPTKPFSIGRNWATKGTERLNKEGEGPVIGKVIAISENRYAVVQMAGGHTIADRRNPEEQTDTVTVGLSNQVILATMGLKDALGDRVSSQTYAERPSDEDKEVAPTAPEAQSDHVGREVPEDQLEAEAPVDRSQVLKDMPVGGRVMSTDDTQVFEKRNTNQWALISGDGELIDDDTVLGMVKQGEERGMSYTAQEPEDGSENAPESAPEAAEAPEAQPAPESPAEEAPEAAELAPETEAPVEEAPEEPKESKPTPVNDIVDGLAELEQAAEDVESANLSGEEADEVLDGAAFNFVGADGKNYGVVTGADQNGDFNFTVVDENGAEVASHIIGSEENRVLAERIANPTGAKKAEEAPAAEATPEAAPEATPEAPEAETYNENGLTEAEQRELTGYTRLASRSYEQFKDEEGDRYKALADELLARGEERKASAPAEQAETAPESAPQAEEAPEATPEPEKAPEAAPAPSLVEPDAAPEKAEKAPVNGEEGFVPIDGRGLKDNKEESAEEAPAPAGPFGISFEQRRDGLDHPVASNPEAMNDEENEEFARQDIALSWAQHENRRGAEAIARGKLADLERRVQSRIDSESMKRQRDIQNGNSLEESTGESNESETAPAEAETPEAPAAEAPETAPVVAPNANEDGLLPDEAARLADLENRQAAAFRGETNEDPNSFDAEISELIRHGRLRGRGREVGPFVARNPAPEPAPEQDSEPEATPEPVAIPKPAAPEAPAAEAPRARRARGEVVPVADADGNMITRGDKIGHPTLGPVEITNTIPGSGRVEFIDPTTGRKKSVKAARVRKIDPNAAEAAPEEQPTTANPGERFVDAATGKQGFGDKNGNRVLVGGRVRDAIGNTGTVKSVYTAANGGAWIPVLWDSDGKVRRVMGNVLEADNSTVPNAAPEEPFEVARPSTSPAPSPEPAPAPAEEPFEPVRPSATPAPEPVPEAAPEAETHEAMMARLQALVDATPVNGKITSGSQNFYKISDSQWQFNEGSLLTPTAVQNMMALGERRGERYEIAEGRPAQINAPATDVPAVDAPQAPTGTVLDPAERERRIGMLRGLPPGTTIKPRSGEYTLTKNGSDDWSSTVDDGVYDTEDIYGIVESGRAGGLLYEVTRPTEQTAPTVLPTVTLADVPLEANSLVPPTVASRLEAFRRAPIGTTITSPAGLTVYTKQADNEWTSPDIQGATIKNSTLAVAADSDNGHWIFNKTPEAEPEGVNISALSVTDRLAAFRQAPIGSKMTSTGGKVFTKTSDREWTNHLGEVFTPADLSYFAGRTDVSGAYGLTLPETSATPSAPTPISTGSTLPADRGERASAIKALPIGSKIDVRGHTFQKISENQWVAADGDPHTDVDVSWAGSRTAPGVVTLPTPKPIPQDLESRIRVSEQAPIGTIVTSSTGESYTKISTTEWADTATLRSFRYGLGEFASKLKNNVYTGNYFVQGFDVPDIAPELNADGSSTQPLPVDTTERLELLGKMPVGTLVQHELGRIYTKVGPNQWLDNSTGFREADESVVGLIHSADGWSVTTPAPEPEAPADAIHDKLPVGAFLPNAEGSTSGLKRVGPDKWEMVKDGEPTGRFATDDTVKMFQELQGTTPTLPVDNRLGEPLGFSPEELKLPGGVSLGKFIEQGGRVSSLEPVQQQAIQAGYDRFIENINKNLPEGYTVALERGAVSFSPSGISSQVAFFHNGRKITSPSFTSSRTMGDSASRYIRMSRDSRTGRSVSSVEHALFTLPDSHQGSGVSGVFLRLSKQMYRQMGLDRITIHADISVGGYAWARGGFDFKSPSYMEDAISDWETRANWNIPEGRKDEWAEGLKQFNALKEQATEEAFKNKTHPLPIDFANIGRPEGNVTSEDTWFGKQMMMGSDWYGEFPLNSNVPSATVAPSP